MLLLVLVSACTSVPVNPEALEANLISAYKPPTSVPTRKKIGQLLHRAELAFLGDNLTTPLDNNAYFHYLHVLAIDPENPEALFGLSEIAERYLDLAIAHANRFELKIASDFLLKAKSVDEHHANVQAVEKRIDQQKSLKSEKFTLSLSQLRSRASSLSHRLLDIGQLIARKDASVVIKAPSDTMGRWIYQQLNAADEVRVKAEFRADDSAQVRIFY